MSNEYKNLNINISAEFDGHIPSQQNLPESKAECAVKEWIESHTGGTIYWPLRSDNKVECLCQLISSLSLKNKIKNVLIVSDKLEEFQNWNLGSAFKGKVEFVSAMSIFDPLRSCVTKEQYYKAVKCLSENNAKMQSQVDNPVLGNRGFLDKQETALREENKKYREIISTYENQKRINELKEIYWDLVFLDLKDPLHKWDKYIYSHWRLVISPVLPRKESIEGKDMKVNDNDLPKKSLSDAVFPKQEKLDQIFKEYNDEAAKYSPDFEKMKNLKHEMNSLTEEKEGWEKAREVNIDKVKGYKISLEEINSHIQEDMGYLRIAGQLREKDLEVLVNTAAGINMAIEELSKWRGISQAK